MQNTLPETRLYDYTNFYCLGLKRFMHMEVYYSGIIFIYIFPKKNISVT